MLVDNIFVYLLTFILVSVLFYLFQEKMSKYFQSTPTIILPSLFYKKVVNGYGILINALYVTNKKELEKGIHEIVKKRADGRYLGAGIKGNAEFDSVSFSLDSFYDLLRFQTESKSHFIFDLNRSVKLHELKEFFQNTCTIQIEDEEFFNDNNKTLFPYEEVLSNYQNKLNKKSIQIGFFTDDSESLYLFVFPQKKEALVKKAILDIGFEYKRVPVFSTMMSKKTYKQKMALS